MDVTSTSPLTPAPAAAAPDRDPASADGGRDIFLKLLIAQLEHQDPLAPVENTEFTAQMAQFSSLEQMEAMNANLTALIASQKAINGVQAADLIGKDVTVAGNTTQVREGMGTPLRYRLSDPGAQVTIQVFDDQGQVVQTLHATNQPAGEHTVPWPTGETAVPADGTYRFEVTAVNGAGNPVDVETFSQGRVDGIDLNGEGAALMVNGARVDLSSILSVHDATPGT